MSLAEPVAGTRRLAAILAADVAGYSRLMGADEERTLAARLAKEAVAFGMDGSLREAANADLYRFMALELTEDKKEAHQAWRERRKPALTGR
jgi:hypothetical protein